MNSSFDEEATAWLLHETGCVSLVASDHLPSLSNSVHHLCERGSMMTDEGRPARVLLYKNSRWQG